ncbi:glycoside hydrolase family protein [Haloferax elongans ATCC BAA-1513]|uniref:Glycoside hydrolase family protein n=1 Tax=Haloferax elongans ATCC BAA-1513 TaxID=1230453 RepID=M0HP58_HALEO|nr:glycoside hydrolase family protein [Haloferax elongans ATCC BAA-1513]
MTHQYEQDGEYDVSLTVTDDDGASKETIKSISINNRRPSINFQSENGIMIPGLGEKAIPVAAGAPVEFEVETSDEDGEVMSVSWDFDDGVQKNGETVEHNFRQICFYRPKVTVTDDDGGKRTKTFNVISGTIEQVEVVFMDKSTETHQVISALAQGSKKFIKFVRTPEGMYQYNPDNQGTLLV